MGPAPKGEGSREEWSGHWRGMHRVRRLKFGRAAEYLQGDSSPTPASEVRSKETEGPRLLEKGIGKLNHQWYVGCERKRKGQLPRREVSEVVFR
jgi:hypothetical protein